MYGATAVLVIILVNEYRTNPRNNFTLMSGTPFKLMDNDFFLLMS